MATVNLSSIITPANVLTASNAETLTNKTINIASNTLTGVQSTLVSGTSIKTVNSTSLLGSGDIAISAGFTLGTPVATTSGTAINFTGIPSGVKQIIINFSEVSLSGTDFITVLIGDSGGIEVTGYKGRFNSMTSPSTMSFGGSNTQFYAGKSVDATEKISGIITLSLENASTFTFSYSAITSNDSANVVFLAGGSKALSATLDRVRITTQNGTDTFDAGEVNIAYI